MKNVRDEIAVFVQEIKNSSHFGHQVRHHETIPALTPDFGNSDLQLSPELHNALKAQGISKLYSHQCEALEGARAGKNILIATPTSSGKSLGYTLPVFESILHSPETRALYLFPLKALGRDQCKITQEFASELKENTISVEVYDGDTSPYKRGKIKSNPPNILITNPDMLHSGFLAFHASWESFFRNLQYIVIDELHTYRGVFGSHVAQILRRLNRVANHYGAKPTFITCSATIADPEEFAETLTGKKFLVITKNGSPSAERHFLFLDPTNTPYTEAVRLIHMLLKKNLKVIAFTKSRKVTELIHGWLIQQDKSLEKAVSSYRSGFLPEERREIEKGLFEDTIKAVISTSALEMGINVGGLDVCILVGYPGTIINTWQRGGRAGRGKRSALVILLAQQDALDKYFMKNPDDFFKRDYEKAVLDPFNAPILKAHLICAASELPLSKKDPFFEVSIISPLVDSLVQKADLLEAVEGDLYFSSRTRPHRFVDIRSAGESYTIIDKESRKVIGSISGTKAFTECHPGAIYLHMAMQYSIDAIDLPNKNIIAQATRVSYYTKPHKEKETEILEVTASKPIGNFVTKKGRLKITETISGYEKRSVNEQNRLSSHPLDLPPILYETVGFWIEIERSIEQAVSKKGLHFMGGIHAIEHSLISLFPLFALSDRDDIGGISIPYHPQLKKGGVFIYDGYPGGVGLCERGYETLEALLQSTLKLIATCECETGCPSCIHSPKCGSGNKPLDKAAAVEVLRLLLALEPLPVTENSNDQFMDDLYPDEGASQNRMEEKRICYFDLETQRSADEVGGWRNIHLMRLAVGVVYDSIDKAFYTYYESDAEALLKKLMDADLVVGFNVVRFDYTVLKPYSAVDLSKIPTFDMLADVHARLGYRLSLNHLATHTLNAEKSADGLQSLQWFKEGALDKVAVYCEKDVAITRDLFLHGEANGHVLFEKKGKGVVRLPVEWKIATILDQLQQKR